MKTGNATEHIKIKLSNGVTILYLHTKNDPISAGHIFFQSGADDESAHQRGISNLMWSLFTKGTEQRSAKRLAEDVESLGAHIGAGASHDYSTVSFYALSEYMHETFELVAEMLFHPAFHADETQKERNALVASIQSKKENIFTVAHEEMNRRLYGGHPLGKPVSGEVGTVSALKPDHLERWHDKVVVPNHAIVALASNVPFKQALPDLERYFGPETWAVGDLSWRRPISEPRYPSEPVATTVNTRFEQAYLMVSHPAPSSSSRSYVAMKTLNAILGGGMSARLFQSIREKHGLAYDVGSFYPTRRAGSGLYVYLGLQPNRIADAKPLIDQELDRLVNEEIPADELDQMKRYLKGTYLLDHQTNSQRAHYLGWWEALGLASNFDATYLEEIDALTPADLKAAAQSSLTRPSVVLEAVPGGRTPTPARS